ncbi:MAG: hypothetical protein HY288_01970 [Planctomycetia bacterium]|nr:hypothetical protein [Planctomycetia bacterium]
MAKLAYLVLGLALVTAWMATTSARGAEDKIDVTGTWNVEVDLGGQTGAPVFTFKQEGEKVTGKYKGQFGEAEVTGKVKGKEIEFTFEIQGGGKVVYNGTIDKDTMKGKVDYAGQASGTWTGKKEPKKT